VDKIPPLETEQQARELTAVRAVYDAFARDPGPGKMAPRTHKMLISACVAAGVELGDYDRRVILWLSQWEPQACAVVAGLIGRAHADGDAGRLAEIRRTLAESGQFPALALGAIERIAEGGQP
jgi:hypothetical protein